MVTLADLTAELLQRSNGTICGTFLFKARSTVQMLALSIGMLAINMQAGQTQEMAFLLVTLLGLKLSVAVKQNNDYDLGIDVLFPSSSLSGTE